VQTLEHDTDSVDRPLCEVVGQYCENLGWLARGPSTRITVCCRGYWADAEGEAS
jgi:hypothetical protein